MGDVVDEAGLGGKAGEVVVRLATGTELAAEGKGGGVEVVETVLVDVANADLDSRVVGSVDQLVGGRALAGDVQVHNFAVGVLHLVFCSMRQYRVCGGCGGGVRCV